MSIITKEMVIKATRQIDHWVDLEEVEVAIRAILPDILEAAAKVVEVSGRIPVGIVANRVRALAQTQDET